LRFAPARSCHLQSVQGAFKVAPVDNAENRDCLARYAV